MSLRKRRKNLFIPHYILLNIHNKTKAIKKRYRMKIIINTPQF